MKKRNSILFPLLGILFSALLAGSCGKGERTTRESPGKAPSGPAARKGGETPGKGAKSSAGAKVFPEKVTKGLPPNMVKALRKAHKENRLLLVEVYDPECNFCQDMEEVLGEPDVQEAMKPFVYIKVGKDVQRLVEEFALTMTPTFLVFKPDGKPMDDFFEGFRSGKVFIAELKNVQNVFHGKPRIEIPEDDNPNYGKG